MTENPDRKDVFSSADDMAAPKRGKSSSAGAEAERMPPIESCVTVEFETHSTPATVVSAKKAIDVFREDLSLRLESSVQLSVDQVLKSDPECSLVDLDRAIPHILTFRHGKLQDQVEGRTRVVVISFMQLMPQGEAVRASVFGTSKDADRVVARIYECLWRAAGDERSWRGDGFKNVHAMGYTTATDAGLQCELDRLFSARFARMIAETIVDKKGLGERMAVRPLDPDTRQPRRIDPHVVVRLRQLHLDVRITDMASNRIWESFVVLTPKDKMVAGKGTYRIVTELEYEDHVKLVHRIKGALELPEA
ncbi:MAG: hypothetical protein HY763_12805 [Planctomycetes bacterium]|nr:hypothetical protein [Planctomycetota bacterium]